MILSIDSTNREKIIVALKKGQSVMESAEEENSVGSQVLLPAIIKLLKKRKIEFGDLTEIEVKRGPGSFTGIRVGASVANALGFALNIPVNGKKMETEFEY